MIFIRKKNLRVIFAIVILIMMSFACEWAVPNPKLTSVTCTQSGSEDAKCSYTCKKGDSLISDDMYIFGYTPGGFANIEDEAELEKLCAQWSPDKYSQPASVVSEVTEPPAEVPTEAPTEVPTEAPTELPTPILTGDVTYCDLVSRSVNLRLVEGFSAEEFSHQVTIGGEAMSCKVNEGNATLLTCTFPVTTKFPASIQASKDGSVVNEFEYNGSNCVVPEVNDNNGEESPQDLPSDEIVCDPVILAMDKVCVPMP